MAKNNSFRFIVISSIILFFVILADINRIDNTSLINDLNYKETKYIYFAWYNNSTYIDKHVSINNPDSIRYFFSILKGGKEERLNRKNILQDVDVYIVPINNEKKKKFEMIITKKDNEVYYTANGNVNPCFRNDSILNFLKQIGFKLNEY